MRMMGISIMVLEVLVLVLVVIWIRKSSGLGVVGRTSRGYSNFRKGKKMETNNAL